MKANKSKFPFNMVEKMMPSYGLIAIMGWLFVLIAFLFTGVTMALTVITGTLRMRAGVLVKFYQQASSK